MSVTRELSGERIGRLTVLERAPKRGRRTAWRCRCDCGQELVVLTTNLTRAHTMSCGCAQRDVARAVGVASRRHGLYLGNDHSPTFRSWATMVARCFDPRTRGYKYYGGRGITVSDAWMGSSGYATFLRDMGERPPGTSLDRKDANGNYEPGNCRWGTAGEQARNRRRPDPASYPRQR